MDMDEFGIGEKFQQKPDAASVRWRFQDERTALSPLNLFEEGIESSAPFANFGKVNIAKGEIFFELFFLTQKHPAHTRRFKRGSSQSKFVFLWPSESHFDIVHWSTSRQKERQERSVFLFSGEKRVRKTDLISVWITESLILSDEIVKVRRAITPVAQDEDRRLNCDVFEQRFESPFASSPEAIL